SHRYRDPIHGDDAYVVLASRLLVEAVAGEPDVSPQDHRRWPVWQLVAPHAFHLLRTLSAVPGAEPCLIDQVAHVVDLAVRYLFFRGFRSQAKVEYDAMYRNCGDCLGAEHPRTLAAPYGTALVLSANGEFSAAQTQYETILQLRRRVLGEEHPDTLATRHSLAVVLHDRGDYVSAQAEYQATLELRRRVLGEEHPDTLATRHSLAVMLHARGDYVSAQAEYQATLELRRPRLAQEHLH